MKNNKSKNKKKLIVLSTVGLLTVLSGTLAYFTTSDTFSNLFKIPKYQPKVVETFESPNNWIPGVTTPQDITITNNGNIDIALRASYEEQWTSENGNNIDLIDSNGNRASIINFNDGWSKDADGYYYYGSKENLTRLLPNEKSSSFISGVTFNENIEL